MLDVIYEDNHLLAADKPAGLLTQPTELSQESLLILCRRYIKDKYQKPGNVFLEAAHRIDKPVSGVVLFARTSKALPRLHASMRSNEALKVYYAQVRGTLPQKEGALVHYLVHEEFRAAVSKKEDPRAKEARLRYRVLAENKETSFVEITLETGRYHQIRAQFAAIGCPILNDVKYGGPSWKEGEGIALHHARLELPHPVGRALLVLEAPLPSWARKID